MSPLSHYPVLLLLCSPLNFQEPKGFSGLDVSAEEKSGEVTHYKCSASLYMFIWPSFLRRRKIFYRMVRDLCTVLSHEAVQKNSPQNDAGFDVFIYQTKCFGYNSIDISGMSFHKNPSHSSLSPNPPLLAMTRLTALAKPIISIGL